MSRLGYKSFTPAPFEPRQPDRVEFIIKSPPQETGKGCVNALAQWGSVLIGILTLVATIFFATLGANLLGSVVGPGNIQLIVMAGIGIGLTALISSLTIFLTSFETNNLIKEYKEYLDKTRKDLTKANQNFRSRLYEIDPNPEELEKVIDQGKGRYLWERQPHISNFLKVRVGVAPQHSGPYDLKSGLSGHSSNQDSLQTKEVIPLINKFNNIEKTPGIISLKEAHVLGIAGPPQMTSELAYAIACQLATHHSPENVKLMVLCGTNRLDNWFWAGWLPHTQPLEPNNTRPMLSGDMALNKQQAETLRMVLNQRIEKSRNGSESEKQLARLPYLVVFIDRTEGLWFDQNFVDSLLKKGPEQNIYTVFLALTVEQLPKEALAYISLIQEAQMRVVVSNSQGFEVVNDFWQADQLSLKKADRIARELAPLQLSQDASNFIMPNSINFFEALGWSKVDDKKVADNWVKYPIANLDCILGLRDNGQLMVINLDENEHGTHGVLTGMTGMGKGVLLSAFITSLALNNHPSRLNFLLADFKGGATFNVFKNLPHTVGVLTDNDIDDIGGARFFNSLGQELKRRKRIIDAAQRRYGNQVQKIRDFEAIAPDTCFPFLFVIVDEYAELAKNLPERMDEFITIAQQGRSLGVFLLLSMQTRETLKDSVLNNMRYRLSLKIRSASDSKDLIGTTQAAEISNRGRGYFRCDDELLLFQTASLMGKSLSQPIISSGNYVPVFPIDNNWKELQPALQTSKRSNQVNDGERNENVLTDVEVAVAACKYAEKLMPLKQPNFIPWLPTLPTNLALTNHMPDVFKNEHFTGRPVEKTWLRIPVGILDLNWEQRQPILYTDFTQGKHLEFLGVQNSGRTLAMLSTVLGLYATHSAQELVFAFIDFGGFLNFFRNIDSAGIYFNAGQQTEIQFFLKELRWAIDKRREAFSSLATGNVAKDLVDYRKYQRSQGIPEDKLHQAIVVVIDNFTAWTQTHPDFSYDVLPDFRYIVQNGASFGIYFILTAGKPSDVSNDSLSANFQKIMLRMDLDDMSVTPYNKQIVKVWNERNGRGFIENSGNFNVAEIQCFQPGAGSEDDQFNLLQTLVAEIKDGSYAHQN